MKSTVLVAISIAVLSGCAEDTPPGTALPSPLLTADRDRLWILLRASRLGDGRDCQEHYLVADDPRYQGMEQKCDFWTRNFADYLLLNGFPTIEQQHLQQTAYWQWFVQKRAEIQACRNALGVLAVPSTAEARREHYRHRNQCDPFDDAINSKKMTLTELGIQYP